MHTIKDGSYRAFPYCMNTTIHDTTPPIKTMRDSTTPAHRNQPAKSDNRTSQKATESTERGTYGKKHSRTQRSEGGLLYDLETVIAQATTVVQK